MATLYLTEYATAASDQGRAMPIAFGPPVATQTLTIGSETKSAAFNTNTHLIRVHVDAICSILIGSSPTATTSSSRMAANQTEYFAVPPGYKLSVISNT